jgi:hypothetical protein
MMANTVQSAPDAVGPSPHRQPAAGNPGWRRLAAALRDTVVGAPAWGQYRLRRPLSVIVLGMHRSGTSCFTRMLTDCGLNLGGPVVGANASNKAGHWESAEGLAINELILRRNGGTWDEPPKELRCDALLRCKMRRFVGDLHRHGLAVWKDPRTVLTFLLWKPLLCRYYLVAAVRHPMSVARSLQKRDGFDLRKGLDLWCRYNEQLLAICSAERDVCWIDFDQGPEHYLGVLKRLGAAIGLTIPAGAANSYTPGLRTSDALRGPDDERVERLYALLRAKVQESLRTSGGSC